MGTFAIAVDFSQSIPKKILKDIHACSVSQLVLKNKRFFKPNKLLFGVLQISRFGIIRN